MDAAASRCDVQRQGNDCECDVRVDHCCTRYSKTPHLRAQVYLYLLRSISISISNSAAFSLPSLCACSHRLLQIKALLVEHDIKVDAQDKVKGL